MATAELVAGVVRPRVRRWSAVRCLSALYLVGLGVPLFLYPTGAVYREQSFGAADVFPLSLYLAPLVVAVYFLTRRRLVIDTRYHLPALLVFGATLVFYLSGEVVRGSGLQPQMWAVYVVPMLLGILAGTVVAGYFRPEIVASLFAWPVAATAGAHVIVSLATLGIVDTFISFQRGAFGVGLFSIYQRLIYYPLILAIALCYLLFFARGGVLRTLAIGALLVDLVVVAAREPIVYILIFGMLYVVWARSRRAWATAVALAAAAGAATVIFWSELQQVMLFRKFIRMVSGSEGAATGRRSEIIQSLIQEISDHAIFGTAMTMSGHFGTPHNQYLEYIMRGGVVLLVAALALIGSAIVYGFRLARFDRSYAFFFLMLLTLLVVSFNINTAMRAPYASMLIWTTVGFIWRKYHGQELGELPGEGGELPVRELASG